MMQKTLQPLPLNPLLLLLLLLLLPVLVCSGAGDSTAAYKPVTKRPPLIIVPGSLHTSLWLCDDNDGDDDDGGGRNCSRKMYLNWTNWDDAARQEAWIADMALIYDATSQRYGPPESLARGGSAVAVPAYLWGDPLSIPKRDPWTAPNESTYAALLRGLREDGGYTPGEDLFVAPYDWRLAPDSLQRDFFPRLAALVEHAAAAAAVADGSPRRRPVHLLGHSAGSSVLLAFLHGRTGAWKERHVASYVSLNGNLGGEIDCLENLWHGGDFLNPAEGVDAFDRAAYRATQWSWPITAWCLPNRAVFGAEQVLLTLGPTEQHPRGRAFTAADLPRLFAAVGDDCAASVGAIWPRVERLTDPARPPGHTAVWCLYGTGVPTPLAYDFPGGEVADDDARVSRWGSGDGQQDDATNAACGAWGQFVGGGGEEEAEGEGRSGAGAGAGAGYPVAVQSFPGADHDSLLSDPRTLSYLLEGPLAAVAVTDE